MELFNKNNPGKDPKFHYDDDMDSLELFDELFYRSLKDSNIKRYPSNYVENIQYKDLSIEFASNNLGYRGRYDIEGNEDVLILGCSQTFGTGLPLECTWGDIFAQKINKKYALLAQEGDSIQAQVYKAFKYFEEFGNPKIIVGVFPLVRLEYPLIPSKLKGKQNDVKNYPCIVQSFGHRGDAIPLSVAPHHLDEILPREFYTFYNFVFIQMLEQYCKSNNILLIWNCYEDAGFIDYVKINIPKLLKNYLHINYTDVLPKYSHTWDPTPFNANEFGLEFLDLNHDDYKYKSLYYRAADFNPGKNSGHWGVYTNRYLAEHFYLEYTNRTKEIE